MKNKKINFKTSITIGVCMIIVGCSLISFNYFASKKQKAYDEISFALSDLPSSLDSEGKVTDEKTKEEELKGETSTSIYQTETTDNSSLSQKYYVGKLIIPKISLSKGFAAQESSENDVNKNVAIISPSNYPNEVPGNFILVGHSGHNWRSFFNNIKDLVKGDIAYVYYQNTRYTYELVNSYNEPRGSNLKIYRDKTKATMTLITCSRIDNTKQLILIFEQKSN